MTTLNYNPNCLGTDTWIVVARNKGQRYFRDLGFRGQWAEANDLGNRIAGWDEIYWTVLGDTDIHDYENASPNEADAYGQRFRRFPIRMIG